MNTWQARVDHREFGRGMFAHGRRPEMPHRGLETRPRGHWGVTGD
jgi:hypothetical protein